MQMIITLPKEYYQANTSIGEQIKILLDAVKHGVVLLKGHGRLIDVDQIVYKNECKYASDGSCTTYRIPDIDAMPTIIEADKIGG